MDTAVAIRTLEATYKQSADSIAVESMIAKLTEKVTLQACIYMSYCYHRVLKFRLSVTFFSLIVTLYNIHNSDIDVYTLWILTN
jgi:hypothetical protein